ncbi:MAG: iron ABC transporter permease [Burkholderiaceae bacterium]|nr:MAG: iron ABC transporter permease [Burkholderiaceae bacterium]
MKTHVAATGLLLRTQRITLGYALTVLGALALVAALIGVLSVCLGSTKIGIAQLFGHGESARIAHDVLFNLRLPRTLAAFAVGGLLGLAGALMQVLLRNPLADPYILGTSGGAGVGALTVLLLFGSSVWMSVGAGLGALGAIALVFALARGDGSWTQARLLLTGVAVAAFCGALTSLLLSLAPDGILRGMIFWLLGDLSGADWHAAAIVLLLALLCLLPFARDLNVLALGPQQAHSLGVNVPRVRAAIYLGTAFAVAVSVTTAGMIGFIGLLVPHSLRLLFGNDQRLLLPASALGGGIVLMLADLLSRILIAPQQLPVGVVTAALGAPFFLLLLQRGGR